MADNQQTVEDLGKLVKAKYPDAYKDLSDLDLGRKVKAKYPQYSDFVDVSDKPPGVAPPRIPEALGGESKRTSLSNPLTGKSVEVSTEPNELTFGRVHVPGTNIDTNVTGLFAPGEGAVATLTGRAKAAVRPIAGMVAGLAVDRGVATVAEKMGFPTWAAEALGGVAGTAVGGVAGGARGLIRKLINGEKAPEAPKFDINKLATELFEKEFKKVPQSQEEFAQGMALAKDRLRKLDAELNPKPPETPKAPPPGRGPSTGGAVSFTPTPPAPPPPKPGMAPGSRPGTVMAPGELATSSTRPDIGVQSPPPAPAPRPPLPEQDLFYKQTKAPPPVRAAPTEAPVAQTETGGPPSQSTVFMGGRVADAGEIINAQGKAKTVHLANRFLKLNKTPEDIQSMSGPEFIRHMREEGLEQGNVRGYELGRSLASRTLEDTKADVIAQMNRSGGKSAAAPSAPPPPRPEIKIVEPSAGSKVATNPKAKQAAEAFKAVVPEKSKVGQTETLTNPQRLARRAMNTPREGGINARDPVTKELYREMYPEMVPEHLKKSAAPPPVRSGGSSVEANAKRILDKVRELEPISGVPVSTLRLRSAVQGMSKEEFDAAALLLRKQQKAYLSTHADPHNLSQADQNLLISDPLGTYHVAIAERKPGQ